MTKNSSRPALRLAQRALRGLVRLRFGENRFLLTEVTQRREQRKSGKIRGRQGLRWKRGVPEDVVAQPTPVGRVRAIHGNGYRWTENARRVPESTRNEQHFTGPQLEADWRGFGEQWIAVELGMLNIRNFRLIVDPRLDIQERRLLLRKRGVLFDAVHLHQERMRMVAIKM